MSPTTVFCGTDLLYQTQHEIQITAGSGSMNESFIDTVGCLCSIAVLQGFVIKTVIFNASATVLHEMMYCLSCFFCKVTK